MTDKAIQLFKNKYQCCGCNACEMVCGKKAITMIEDEYGFRFPQIDMGKCVGCGSCQKVCCINNDVELCKPGTVYAASYKNKEISAKSASGGIFAALAKQILTEGGIVFGSAYRRVNNKGEWRIEESEARRVRCAFDLAAKGIGYDVIRKELDAMEKAEGTGVSWSQNRNRLPMLLKHIAYTGDYITDTYYTAYGRNGHRYSKRNNGERAQTYLEGHHEPIVSKEQFERVQTLMGMGLLHSGRKKYTKEQQELLNDSSWQ